MKQPLTKYIKAKKKSDKIQHNSLITQKKKQKNAKAMFI